MKENGDIISSADAVMVKWICTDERVDNTWFFALFSTINYDPQKKSLRFISLKEMWQYGLTVKRYLEYPEVRISEISNVFQEICIYLQRKDYVVHFINGSLFSEDINIILDISLVERKVNYITWQLDGNMIENTLPYEEYYEKYISIDSFPKTMRFDIYQPIKKDEKKEMILKVLLERINRGKLTGFNRIHCLHSVKRMESSFRVLQAWFSVFERTINWLCEEEFLEKNTIYGEEEKRLFETDQVHNDIGYLNQMMNVYNKLLKRLNKIFEVQISEKDFKKSGTDY